MEDLTLPNIGASFKKWRCLHPFSQNARKFLITPKINKIKSKFFGKN
jgi:hypothetical protein